MERLKDILGMIADRGLVPGQLTIGDCIELAQAAQIRVSDVVVAEAAAVNQMTKQEVLSAVLDSFAHNLCAVEIGHTTGSSFLMGTAGKELVGEGKVQLVEDGFLNQVLAYTLSAQVGNHSVGLEPCAGTGDSCTYTGFVKAMLDEIPDREQVARIAAVMLKIGTIFRVGKTTLAVIWKVSAPGRRPRRRRLPSWRRVARSNAQSDCAGVVADDGNPCTPRVMVADFVRPHRRRRDDRKTGGATGHAHFNSGDGAG